MHSRYYSDLAFDLFRSIAGPSLKLPKCVVMPLSSPHRFRNVLIQDLPINNHLSNQVGAAVMDGLIGCMDGKIESQGRIISFGYGSFKSDTYHFT